MIIAQFRDKVLLINDGKLTEALHLNSVNKDEGWAGNTETERTNKIGNYPKIYECRFTVYSTNSPFSLG